MGLRNRPIETYRVRVSEIYDRGRANRYFQPAKSELAWIGWGLRAEQVLGAKQRPLTIILRV